MDKIRFWILLGNELAYVPAKPNVFLAAFFVDLWDDPFTAEDLPAPVRYRACSFFALKKPVYRSRDKDKDRQACQEASNRFLIDPEVFMVCDLAETFDEHHIYLVVEFPGPFKPVEKLRQRRPILFKCLQVTVDTLNKWCPDDVEWNLLGGIRTMDANSLPPDLREVHEALGRKRLYQVSQESHDFRNAHSYDKNFNHIFAPCQTESHTVTHQREFAAFSNILRWYNKDVNRIVAEQSSSAHKASNFTIHFINPPFFCENDGSTGFKYHQEKLWAFPIFVESHSEPNSWKKYTPRSDWMVSSPSHKIPFIISEVISEMQESDRSRMLLEAIAIARAGQFLLQSTSKQRFFVVAVYVDANMVASRYIVMQTGPGNMEGTSALHHDRAVCILQKDFKLTNDDESTDFLREMYNLATRISVLAGDLDKLKKTELDSLKDDAQPLQTLTSKRLARPGPHDRQSGPATDVTMEEIVRRDMPQDEDDMGVFGAEDIQDVLDQMGYNISFILFGHPYLALIVSKTGDKKGYLKFVKEEMEVDILRFLTQIKSPSNHTIAGVRFWRVRGGTVISMPVAGAWLTTLSNPSDQLWSVALQLIEGVAFMHEHNVAHMDLKPQNIIIPPEGGRLSIIDFSVSIRVRGPDVKYSGVVGTEDHMAPEVRRGQYKPMLADLWSCGRTLQELCSCCDSSADCMFLLEIARQLMNYNPEARPKMSTILERMTSARRGKDNVMVPT